MSDQPASFNLFVSLANMKDRGVAAISSPTVYEMEVINCLLSFPSIGILVFMCPRLVKYIRRMAIHKIS